MKIGKRRSNAKRASVRRLDLASTVLAFACSANDVVVPPPPPPPPAPAIDAILPTSVVAGSADLTLTITGSNFVEGRFKGSHAAWVAGGDTTLLATIFVSRTRLIAVIPAALLSDSATAQVLLKTGDLMGDVPLLRSNAIRFTVAPADTLSTGTIVVYGQRTTLPPIAKGSREVSLDGGRWLQLSEGQSLAYGPVAAGSHWLALSNPCTSNHVPTAMEVTVSGHQTVTVTVDIPANCM